MVIKITIHGSPAAMRSAAESSPDLGTLPRERHWVSGVATEGVI